MKKDTTSKVKFKRLQRSLKLASWQAIGLLESIWHCAITNSPGGDIGRLSNEDIASAIEWEQDADLLVDALVECSWLDADPEFRLIVHNWSKHVPTYLKGAYEKHGKLFADVIAKQRAKQLQEQPAKHPAKHDALEGAGEGATYPSLAKPIQAQPSQVEVAAGTAEATAGDEQPKPSRFSKPTQAELEAYFTLRGGDAAEAVRFLNHYDSNGWKVGKNSMKDWQAAVRNWMSNNINRPPPPKPSESSAKFNPSKPVTDHGFKPPTPPPSPPRPTPPKAGGGGH